MLPACLLVHDACVVRRAVLTRLSTCLAVSGYLAGCLAVRVPPAARHHSDADDAHAEMIMPANDELQGEVPASVYLAVASVSPRATQEQLDAAEVNRSTARHSTAQQYTAQQCTAVQSFLFDDRLHYSVASPLTPMHLCVRACACGVCRCCHVLCLLLCDCRSSWMHAMGSTSNLHCQRLPACRQPARPATIYKHLPLADTDTRCVVSRFLFFPCWLVCAFSEPVAMRRLMEAGDRRWRIRLGQ